MEDIKPFTIETKVRFDISTSDFERDISDATNWLIEHIDRNDFQSWDEKIEAEVTIGNRQYDVLLYRDWSAVAVWFNWNYCYEIAISSWAFCHCIEDLFRNWRWVPGIRMLYHWDWSDPELKWNWITVNYRDVEDYLYEDFIDWLKDKKQYDKYCKMKRKQQDDKFNAWLFNNYYKIVDIFIQLRDLNEH